ncbi:MAG: hypothetical protein O7D86_02695 [Proteobacteria bacterium]|nr:hypothetical protein [Pseudomonadota bacterium]
MDNGKDPHHIITGLIRARMEMIKPFKQKRSGSIMKITTPGLEIAKSDFHYYADNPQGRFVKKKQRKSKQALSTMAKRVPCLVAMAA